MNKNDLIKIIHENSEYKKEDIVGIVNLLFDELAQALQTEDKVVIRDFGTFEKIYQKPYIGLNPANGERIQIPGKYKIRFTSGKKLNEDLNK